jgi:hypothetical protein
MPKMREAAVGGVLVPEYQEDCVFGVTLFAIAFFVLLALQFGGVLPRDREE